MFSVLLLGSAVTFACSQDQETVQQHSDLIEAEDKSMTIGSRRRRLPPALEPIEVAGVRYSEVRQANKYGETQKSGYLMASNADTDEQLWLLKIYEINYDEDKETDVQEIFFVEMELSDDSKRIHIENEIEQEFTVDIERQTVSTN
jgi:hypothetical protein